MTNYFNAYQLKAGQTAIFPGPGDVEFMTGLSYMWQWDWLARLARSSAR